MKGPPTPNHQCRYSPLSYFRLLLHTMVSPPLPNTRTHTHFTNPPAPRSRSHLSAPSSFSDPAHNLRRTCAPIPSAPSLPQNSTHGYKKHSAIGYQFQINRTPLTFAQVALGIRKPAPRMSPCASVFLARGPRPAVKGEPIPTRGIDTSQSHHSRLIGPHRG